MGTLAHEIVAEHHKSSDEEDESYFRKDKSIKTDSKIEAADSDCDADISEVKQRDDGIPVQDEINTKRTLLAQETVADHQD